MRKGEVDAAARPGARGCGEPAESTRAPTNQEALAKAVSARRRSGGAPADPESNAAAPP
jgi:hypothetical protein